MAGQSVPELRRKLHLLIERGLFADMDAIATAIGRSPVTLRGWANGGSGSEPNTVPAKNVVSLVTLYQQALPNWSLDEIVRLLEGPADDLENAMSVPSASRMHDLLRKEASWNAATLIHDEQELSLIRRFNPEKPIPHYVVRLGMAFRLEFATRSRAGFMIGLQSAPSGWGIVPASHDRQHACIHFPGTDERGDIGMMVEQSDTGRHMFIAAQAARPFPRQLVEAGDDSIALDRNLLAHFQRHFLQQDRSTRRLFAVEIEFRLGGQDQK